MHSYSHDKRNLLHTNSQVSSLLCAPCLPTLHLLTPDLTWHKYMSQVPRLLSMEDSKVYTLPRLLSMEDSTVTLCQDCYLWKIALYTPGLSNPRPVGRMWPTRQFCAAREIKCFHTFLLN